MPGCKEWGRARETGSSGQALRGRTQDKQVNVLEGNDSCRQCQDEVGQAFEAKVGGRIRNKAENSVLYPVTNEGNINIF